MKAKSKKVGIIGIALIVFLLAVVIVFDVLCAVFSTPISLFFRSDADSVGAAEATQAANEFTVDQVAGGMVLMKNEGDTLPLPSGTSARCPQNSCISVRARPAAGTGIPTRSSTLKTRSPKRAFRSTRICGISTVI